MYPTDIMFKQTQVDHGSTVYVRLQDAELSNFFKGNNGPSNKAKFTLIKFTQRLPTDGVRQIGRQQCYANWHF